MFRHLKLLACALTLIAAFPSADAAKNETNFRQAKIELVNIFKVLDQPKTLYCGCDIVFPKKGYKPDLKSCGYKIRKNKTRALRIEAEHIMPAWEFGHKLTCWRQGKRGLCSNKSAEFQKMEGDLHNLYPSVGEVNADRSNYKFAMQVRGKSPYGQCQMIFDRKRQTVLPPERARGIIARAYLYMSKTYGIRLSADQQTLFNFWNNRYPPKADECLKNRLAAAIQGNDNEFVSAKCRRNQYEKRQNL